MTYCLYLDHLNECMMGGETLARHHRMQEMAWTKTEKIKQDDAVHTCMEAVK